MKIPSVSNCSFKGVYLSNELRPGNQRKLGQKLREAINANGINDIYETRDKDILLECGPRNGVNVVVVKKDMKRILDDRYSRWNGRLY